jgi:dipeptidyl aminopeptidase/acylaminoacyl peptidase
MIGRCSSLTKVFALTIFMGTLGYAISARAISSQNEGANNRERWDDKHIAAHAPMSIRQKVEFNHPGSVAMSPDGRHVAYVVKHARLATDAYTATLYSIPAIGGSPLRLAQAEDIAVVQWMSDGVHLMYLARTHGLYQGWIVRSDGSARRQVTRHITGVGGVLNDEQLRGNPFQISSDGQRALFYTRDTVSALRKAAERFDGPVLYTGRMLSEQFESPRTEWQNESAAAAELWLVDLHTGRERRVWTAPGPATGNFVPLQFAWSPDDSTVAILYEYDGDSWINRSRLAFLSTTTWIVRDVLPQLGWGIDPKWSSDGRSVTFRSEGEISDRSQPRFAISLYRYNIDDGRLLRVIAPENSADSVASDGAQKTVAGHLLNSCTFDHRHTRAACISEDANTPPAVAMYEVGIHGDLAGPEHILVKLNPELVLASIGKARPLPWRLENGQTGTSGLILPTDYTPGRRYPLVVILYNQYWPGAFTGTVELTSYAPQTFAGHGYVVLLQNLPGNAFHYPAGDFAGARAQEADGVMKSLRVMVDTLVTQGLVDSSRMGIMGWSWGCFFTSYILTHDTDWFRAGAVGDGQNHNPSAYWRENDSFREQEDQFFGGGPNGPYSDRWRAVSPILNADKMRTPLLMEYSELYLMGIEFYRALLEQDKSAELIIYPHEKHSFVRPSNQYASMMRHFDWFNFWLLGEEDPDPVKIEQYMRWRKLRQASQTNSNSTKAITSPE